MAQRRVKVLQAVWGDPTGGHANRMWRAGEEFSTSVDNLPDHIYEYLDEPGTSSPPVSEPSTEYFSMAEGQLFHGKLVAALEKLDHDDDSHWTGRGLPRIGVVNRLIEGDFGVSHNDIKSVWPGLCREPSGD
jgi:hypothetical protein